MQSCCQGLRLRSNVIKTRWSNIVHLGKQKLKKTRWSNTHYITSSSFNKSFRKQKLNITSNSNKQDTIDFTKNQNWPCAGPQKQSHKSNHRSIVFEQWIYKGLFFYQKRWSPFFRLPMPCTAHGSFWKLCKINGVLIILLTSFKGDATKSFYSAICKSTNHWHRWIKR